jgi:hypothetical protein
MKISYAITVCNELQEVRRLLDLLLEYKREQDEIVVLIDTTKASDELVSTLRHYEMHNMDHMVVWPGEFQGHFADWKNKLTSYCSGDYVFQIDADELPNEELLKALPSILLDSGSDVILTPRINIVEGITPQHIQMWGWRQNDKGWVQFPDYQWRIFRNTPDITWKNKVHEVLDGYKTYAYLPELEEYSLYHYKHISRQESQNNFYNKL